MRKIVYLLFTVVLTSCSTTKTLNVVKLKKGTKLTKFTATSDAKRHHHIHIYRLDKNSNAKITLEEEKLKIRLIEDEHIVEEGKKIKTGKDYSVGDESLYRFADKYAYRDVIKDTRQETDPAKKVVIDEQVLNNFESRVSNCTDNVFGSSDFETTSSLKYTQNKAVFQTLTIPFKLRSKKGDTPSNVSTAFNAGIAYGYQWNLVRVKPIYDENKKMAGYDKRTLSFSVSPFAGLTSIGLKATNTNNSVSVDKTVLGVSFGGAGVFSFNRVNLGLAIGLDYGLNDSSDWIYQGELWTGIVIGLDLIK